MIQLSAVLGERLRFVLEAAVGQDRRARGLIRHFNHPRDHRERPLNVPRRGALQNDQPQHILFRLKACGTTSSAEWLLISGVRASQKAYFGRSSTTFESTGVHSTSPHRSPPPRGGAVMIKRSSIDPRAASPTFRSEATVTDTCARASSTPNAGAPVVSEDGRDAQIKHQHET